jgi:protein ImuA
MPSATTLDALRRLLAGLPHAGVAADGGRVGFGCAGLDAALGGGLARAALHEVLAEAADRAAALAVALGLAGRAAAGRTMLWVRQDAPGAGRPHPPGLAALGLDPARLLLVRAADMAGVLRAGADGARCAALGAVLIEPAGAGRGFDLTASRRLSLAAQGSGVFTLLLRAGPATPSAAQTRWLVAGRPSRALAANAPGAPAFALRLLRHRQGLGEQGWMVEWDHAERGFRESSLSRPAPASGAVVAFPAGRSAAAGGVAAA